MNSDGHGNDGSAVAGDGAQVPAAVRPPPPPPRKRSATLQGVTTPGGADDSGSFGLAPSADAPPSLEALDSAIGFAPTPPAPPSALSDGGSAAKPISLSSTGPVPSQRGGGPLSKPAAPPRPRTASGPPSAALAALPATPAPAPVVAQVPAVGEEAPLPIREADGQSALALPDEGHTPTRRRSRRLLKIPDDNVPSTTPAPAASGSAPVSAPAASPQPISASMPAILAPPSSPSSSPPPSQPVIATPASMVVPPSERIPHLNDDASVIRPIPILAVGEAIPSAPAPPPAPAAPAIFARPGEVEITEPAAPSPLAAAKAASAAAPPPPAALRPAEAAAPASLESTLPSAASPLRTSPEAAPKVATEAAAIPAEEVDALEEIEPDRESGPNSDQRSTARSTGEIEAIEELEEVDSGRISTEIPIEMELEPAQPKRPPPPPKRTDGPPSAPASAPPTSAPTSPPAAAAAKPASKPAPPTPKAEPKKRAWWDEIFSEDFMRTMDQPKPSHIQREVNFIEESLGVEKGAVVLDLACGMGSHAVELASRGYSVVGFDLSLAMLARASDEAQERGQKLNFLQGDMREMAFEEMFDGIYCWSTSFGYFDEEKNFDVLARMHRALRTGGMLLIDIINRDFIAPRQPSLVWFEGEGCVCMDEMFVDFFTSRLKVKRTVMFEDGRTREVDYSIRIYNLHEIGKMMHDCGFRVIQVTGQPAHPGVFFGSESPRIIVLAERAE